MNASRSAPTRLDSLVESFMERQRRGERPSIEDYVREHPDLADEIREVFPALEMMEEFASSAGRETEATPGADTTPAEAPKQLGEFRIVGEIGHGGMGVVYEAVQESLGRHVALKVMPAQARSNPVYVERFRREAKAAAGLHHTNIVPVFGVGEHEGVSYYAMQYIRGQTLEAVLQELRAIRDPKGNAPRAAPTAELSRITTDMLTGRFEVGTQSEARSSTSNSSVSQLTVRSGDRQETLDPSRSSPSQYFRNVAGIAVQVADGLAYAHGQGVIHRDIKPSNLLLDLGGTVWITDFGLAKAQDSGELTSPGDILGTLRYMSPEQLTGVADARSDVYSLGITLYELVTMQPAFDDPVKARVIDRIRQHEPVRPRRLEPLLPKDLETIILTATAKEPQRRYPTAGALAEDLRRFLADRPIQARRASRMEHAWRWCRRNPVPAWSFAGLVVVLLTGIIVSSVFASLATDRADREEKAHSRADGELRRAEKEWQRAEQALLRSQVSDHTMKIHLAQRALADKDPTRVRQLLDECREDLRGWEHQFLRRRCDECLQVLPAGHLGGPTCVIWTPDGRGIVSGSRDGKVILRDALSGRHWLELDGHQDPIRSLVFSSDGKRLVSQSEQRLCLWDAETGQRQHTRDARSPEVLLALAIHPDGKRLAIVLGVPKQSKSRLEEWEPATGRESGLLGSTGIHTFGGVAYSPDGKRLAVAIHMQGVRVYAFEPETPGVKLHVEVKAYGGSIGAGQLAYSPDGRRLVLGAAIVNAETGRVERSLTGFRGGPQRKVQFSPDGKHLVAGEFEGIYRQPITVWDVETGAAILALGEESAGSDAVFHPDGERVLSRAGGDIQIWRLPALRKPPAAPEPLAVSDELRAGFLGPDGKWALSLVGQTFAEGQWHQEVALWDAATGRIVHRFSCQYAGKEPRGKVPLLVETLLYYVPYRFSNDLRILARRVGSEISLLDTATGQELARFTPDFRPGIGLDISPDGTTLAVPAAGAKSGPNILDARTGQVRWTLPKVGDLSFSSDGKLLAARRLNDDPLQLNQFRVWETATGRVILDQEEPVWAVMELAFSPDGRYLAVGGSDYPSRVPIRIRELATGKVVLTLPGQPADVRSLAYSPDGKRLAASYADGRVKVWDTTMGLDLLTLEGCSRRVRFSPDGRRLWSGPDFFILGRFNEGEPQVALHEKLIGMYFWSLNRKNPGPGVQFWEANPMP